jgi:hypothetical protein
MGTHGYVAVKAAPGKIYNTIIGMTISGDEYGLECVSQWYFDIKKANPNWTHNQVVNAVVNKDPGWLFSDLYGNQSWISYSAELDIDQHEVKITNHSTGKRVKWITFTPDSGSVFEPGYN